jgi:hypothetical protein
MTKHQNKSSAIFKHIAKGRNANNTFAKSLKSSLFSKTSILALFSFWVITSTTQAQIQQPQIPQTETFKPVTFENIYTPKPNKSLQQQNTLYQKEQLKRTNQQNEIDIIRQEIAKQRKDVKQNASKSKLIDTNEYKRNLQNFENALAQLKTIAANPNPSLSDAFYTTENTFGKPYLTKSEYESILSKSAKFIKQWMKENNYNPNDNEAKHLAIQKFMSEKLTISEVKDTKEFGTTIKTSQHLPFFYDYNDYQAEQDHRNFFVTKALATGGGQCNSMPMVYLLLAEKLNAPTYLTFAPQHSFIKYTKNNGEVENYEPTSNWHINDLWYQENLFIKPEAIASGIYLDTLSKHKIVANCMLELAIQYIRLMPLDDGKFLKKCLWEAHQYFPRDNNIASAFIYSSYLKGLLTLYIAENKITDIEKIKDNEYAYGIQKEYQKNEIYIKELGYQDIPEGIYEAMLQEHEFKGKVQKSYNITGKQKRNLFIEPK